MDMNLLPDNSRFPFWKDATVYRRALHVAQQNPAANDANPGTEQAPLKTISAAAKRLRPSEKVLIHTGIYRETVCPAQGGGGPDQMIAYEAVPGEKVVIAATEQVTPDARPSTGWRIPEVSGGATVWMTDLPENIFAAYNPFLVRNAYEYLYQYGERQDPEWMKRVMLRRGSVFFRGQPLRQVLFARDLATQDGAFWVEEPGLRIHFRLPGDTNPGEPLEISVREQTFAPRETGLGYIRISGLTLQNSADGLPVPQRGSLSSNRGHHWIIENCTIDGANGVGISLGAQSWDGQETPEMGGHVVRRCEIRNCGICGIAGARGVRYSLFEDNLFEAIGYHNLERMWECAAIKFHFAENCLIRHNIFRHFQYAAGIWLDVDNVNNRITGNVFADIETLNAGVYSEMNYQLNMFDHNVFWNIRGCGILAESNEKAVIAHNLFGEFPDRQAVYCSLYQAARKSSGRTGICHANQVINNVIIRGPHRVAFARREQNVCDGNLYHQNDDDCCFQILLPEPGNFQNLAGWQEFFGFDHHSQQAKIDATFDADTLSLRLSSDSFEPTGIESPLLGGELTHPEPGPFTKKQWAALKRGENICMEALARRIAADTPDGMAFSDDRPGANSVVLIKQKLVE